MSSSSPLSSTSASLLAVCPPSDLLIDDVRLQSLWLSLQQRKWRSLALVSATRGTGTLAAANDLAKIAWWYTGQPTAVFDMRDLSLRLLDHQLRDMASQVEGAERVFIALRSTDENPTAVPLARAADACVLCVQLGKTEARSALKTLEAIGRHRFIGTILVNVTGEPPRPPAPLRVDAPRASSPSRAPKPVVHSGASVTPLGAYGNEPRHRGGRSWPRGQG